MATSWKERIEKWSPRKSSAKTLSLLEFIVIVVFYSSTLYASLMMMAGEVSPTEGTEQIPISFFLFLSDLMIGSPGIGGSFPSSKQRRLLHEVVLLISVLFEPLHLPLQALFQLHDRR